MNVVATLEREASYAYDNNGNVTEVGTTTFYAYDFDNRLTQSAIWNGTGTTTTTYAYDPFGNRISQTASTTMTLYPSKYYSITTTTTGTSTVATSTDYLYSDASLLGTVDQKMVNGTATGTAITRYNHPDNLGSTNVTSDASGNLAQWLDYAPYGSVIASQNTGTTTAARQYIGQYSDPSGLDYLNARYYNPAQGQFLAEDPAFLMLGNSSQVQQLTQQQQNQFLTNPQQLNAYSYAGDNPLIAKDPSGNSGVVDLIYGGLYVIGLANTTAAGINYGADQPNSSQLASDRNQFYFDFGTSMASTLPTLGVVAVSPEAAGGIDAGTLVLTGYDAYCGSHTCSNFSNSSSNAAEQVLQSLPAPNVELTLQGPQVISNGNGSPASYSNMNANAPSNSNNSYRASAPSASSGGGSASTQNLIGLYQSLVSVLTSYVNALSHNNGH